MISPRFALAALLLVAGSGCRRGSGEPASSPVEAHWSYQGEAGPSHWADLDPDFSLCRAGLQQSPIDLGEASPVALADPRLSLRPSDFHIFNDGHTIQITFEGPQELVLDTLTYQLVQFHFHTPAEHTLASRELPLEVHFLFSTGDRLAVVAVLAEEGAPQAELQKFWDDLPANAGEQGHLRTEIDPVALLPVDRTQFRYAGSLTTPPCSEGVEWIVFRQPITLSGEQLNRIRTILGENRRPVQALQSRRPGLDQPDSQ